MVPLCVFTGFVAINKLRFFRDVAREKRSILGTANSVIPAKAGIQLFVLHCIFWTPVFTGVTNSATTGNMLS